MPAKNPRKRTRIAPAGPTPSAPHFYGWWPWVGRPSFEGVCDALALQYAFLDGLVQPLITGGPHVAPLDRWRVAVRLTQLTAVAEQVVTATRESGDRISSVDAVDWYRRPAPGNAVLTAVARVDAGRAIRTGVADLAARHRSATATAAAVLRSGEPDRVLCGPAADLDLAEFAFTRLVEAVVHGLDLADALGHPGCADPSAANLVSGFLAAAADRGGERPPSALIAVDGQGSLIALSDERHKTRIPAVDWIQAATGRRPAEELLPHSHAWLAAELPLVA